MRALGTGDGKRRGDRGGEGEAAGNTGIVVMLSRVTEWCLRDWDLSRTVSLTVAGRGDTSAAEDGNNEA